MSDRRSASTNGFLGRAQRRMQRVGTMRAAPHVIAPEPRRGRRARDAKDLFRLTIR